MQPDANKIITNEKLLEMPEFKYCGFNKFLLRAWKLDDKGRRRGGRVNTINAKKTLINDDGDEEIDNEEDENVINNNKVQIGKRGSRRIDNNNYLNEDKKTNFNKLILGENIPRNDNPNLHNGNNRSERDIFNRKEEGIAHIDFKKFCDIMKLFNWNYPVDLKIRCMMIYIYI